MLRAVRVALTSAFCCCCAFAKIFFTAVSAMQNIKGANGLARTHLEPVSPLLAMQGPVRVAGPSTAILSRSPLGVPRCMVRGSAFSVFPFNFHKILRRFISNYLRRILCRVEIETAERKRFFDDDL